MITSGDETVIGEQTAAVEDTAPADVVHTLVTATCDNNTHITLVHLSLVISHSGKVVLFTGPVHIR